MGAIREAVSDQTAAVLIEPLSIGVHGKVKVAQDEVADRSALLQRLQALHDENPDFPVLIAGDRDSKYDDVIQLISEAKKMGINRVGLATQ